MIFILNQGPTPMARDRLLSAEHVQNFDILGVVYVGEVAMPRKCIKLYNIYILYTVKIFFMDINLCMIEIWCLGPGLGWILRAQHSGQQSQGHGASNQPIERKLKYVATRIFYP